MPDPAPDPRRAALLRRAFSLSGVLPLGAFLVLHVALNARGLTSDAAFAALVRAFAAVPGLAVLEAAFVFAPLLFHAAFGLWLVVRRVPLATPSPYPPALRVAVRVTGVLAVAFLAMHLPELRFRGTLAHPGAAELLGALDGGLSTMWHGLPWRGVVYLLGSACVCFHFVAGLWAFFARTARGEKPRARRLAAWWSVAVGVTMWLLFADVVVYHATGTRLLGGAAQDDASSAPCPAPSSSAAP